jgi:hypothetical protein
MYYKLNIYPIALLKYDCQNKGKFIILATSSLNIKHVFDQDQAGFIGSDTEKEGRDFYLEDYCLITVDHAVICVLSRNSKGNPWVER